MSDMVRYSKVTAKNQREIVLLKGRPCVWGRCAFCDYTLDNGEDEAAMVEFNRNVLRQITGEFGVLEVINSGSVFELPSQFRIRASKNYSLRFIGVIVSVYLRLKTIFKFLLFLKMV